MIMGGSTATATDSGIMSGAEANTAFDSGGLGGTGISEQDYSSMMGGGGEQIPAYFDDSGNPVYLGKMAGPQANRHQRLMNAALSSFGGGGGGGGYSAGMPTQSMETGSGLGGGGQFFSARPWQIPNAHPEQVDKSYADLVNMFAKMAGGGMKG